MTEEVVLFWACASLALLSAIATVASRSAIRAAVALLAHIISLAGLYLTLAAEMLAVVQLLVYAGAVVVLFVFVIMLIGPSASPPRESASVVSRTLAALLVASTGVVLVPVLWRVGAAAPEIVRCAPSEVGCTQFGSIEGLATGLFGPALVPFELSSALLLVAIVGAIAVARGRHGASEKKGAESPGSPDGGAGRGASHATGHGAAGHAGGGHG
ncbi:MAG: NADH-quinone oxidoreductase subunit J [Deltaproteobacteria bacterium]|nr:NADH-quinone oxidoreductase subunit J [Deltaproteobacteria bacterium]